MSPALLFDNLIITDDVAVAEHWAQITFMQKRAKISRDSVSYIPYLIKRCLLKKVPIKYLIRICTGVKYTLDYIKL